MDKPIIQTKGYVIYAYDNPITKPFETEELAKEYIEKYAGPEYIHIGSIYRRGGSLSMDYPSEKLSVREVILDNQIFPPKEYSPTYSQIGYAAVMNLWGALNGDCSYTPKRISPVFSTADECLKWLKDNDGITIIQYPGFADNQEIKSAECTIQMFAL